MTPAISIVIPVHNQASRLRLTLASLERQEGITPGTFEVIVVDDNNSSDRIADVIAEQQGRDAYPLALLQSRSGGARGVPRNVGIERAQGSVILFLDADAMPGRNLIERHRAAHDRPGRLVVGDMSVLPATEQLLDPSDGTPMADMVPVNPLVLPVDDVRAGLDDEFLLGHASKGVYPGQAPWHTQLEESVEHGESSLSTIAIIPHNLSVDRDAITRLGGFDATLPHLEGLDLGLRAIQAGLTITLARGARTFHLYHSRSGADLSTNIERAREAIGRRFPAVALDVLLLWIPACSGDPLIPAELGIGDWRSLARVLADPVLCADARRFCALRAAVLLPVSPLEARFRSALNRPLDPARMR